MIVECMGGDNVKRRNISCRELIVDPCNKHLGIGMIDGRSKYCQNHDKGYEKKLGNEIGQ